MEWGQMMGGDQQVGMQQPQGAPYGQMMQPQVDIEAARRPAANPQEYEQRLTGWQQLADRFMSDPNLQRAMFMTGAMMMQPIQPGQTAGGALANSAVVGLNAYNVGQQQNLVQQAALRKEARENKELGIREQESTARIGESRARVAEAEARLPGVRAQSNVAAGTVDDAIATARANRRKLETAATEADRQAALDAVRRDSEALTLFAQRPGIERRVQQELDLNEAKLGQAGAATRSTRATARQTELENEGLEALTPAERARLKSTRGTTSGTVQQYDMWANAYDRIKATHPDSPELRGKQSRDEFATYMLATAKEADPAVLLSRLAPVLDEDDELITELRQQISARRGKAPAPAPAPAPGKSKETPKVNNEAEYNALPPGTVYIGPDGKRRKKRG